MITGSLASTFAINSASGAITTGSLFDYEVGPTSYGDGTVATLGIQAIDGNGGTAQAALTVNIADVNDAPVFGPASYSGTVNEEQSSGAAVTFSTAIVATDEDSNSISYSLIGKKYCSNMTKKSFHQ